MFGELLKFSFREVAVVVLLFFLLFGGGLAAIVAFVPQSAGVSPPAPPIQPVSPPSVIPPAPPIVPPVVGETGAVAIPPAPPIPPVVLPAEPVSLVAEDFSVILGARSGGFINPWLNVYDTKALELSATAFDEASIRGVDIDRSTLQIQSVAPQTLYGSVQLTDSGFLRYIPDSDLTVSAEGLTDTIRYSVMTAQDGVVKIADSTITVLLQPEDFERNQTQFDSLLAGAPAVRNSFLGNFRYR